MAFTATKFNEVFTGNRNNRHYGTDQSPYDEDRDDSRNVGFLWPSDATPCSFPEGWSRNLDRRHHWKTCIHWKIILKQILEKQAVMMWNELNKLLRESNGGSSMNWMINLPYSRLIYVLSNYLVVFLLEATDFHSKITNYLPIHNTHLCLCEPASHHTRCHG
jgi:hypothetical protein